MLLEGYNNRILSNFVLNFENFFLPKRCLNCGKFGDFLCEYCENNFLQYQTETVCHVCKKLVIGGGVHENCREKTNLDEVMITLVYNDLVEEIVQEIKYHLYYSVAEVVVRIMMKSIDLTKIRNSVFIPVPLHRFKRWKRGFNQADLIANGISANLKKIGLNIPVHRVIERSRNTKTQVGMKKEERIRNLKSVFRLNKEFNLSAISGKTIILVDDIMTTGTTLEECAVVLKNEGFDVVKALVFARG